jgi:[acyl-carrier-protein] S-malonyltransferase
MPRAFVFPGQGSQAVGMGKALADALPEARLVFEEVDDALSQKLSKLMFEGPEDQLTLTENAQPALMAVSMAIIRTLQSAKIDLPARVAYMAGHSLGEYSALAAAGAISLGDAARLLKIRGQAMQRAVPVGQGAMAALLGAEIDQALEVVAEAAQGEVCAVANDNGGGQVVISGQKTAVDRAIEVAKAKGIKRAIPLAVSAPFHCSLMQPAADAMAEALGKTTINTPSVPIVANVTAEAVMDPVRIRALLVEQVTKMVRWRESMAWMKTKGIDTYVEVGTGKVLSGLVKRLDKDATGISVQGPEDIDALIKTL